MSDVIFHSSTPGGRVESGIAIDDAEISTDTDGNGMETVRLDLAFQPSEGYSIQLTAGHPDATVSYDADSLNQYYGGPWIEFDVYVSNGPSEGTVPVDVAVHAVRMHELE